jgi:drug/metabolite transporter (DMT)-like permease
VVALSDGDLAGLDAAGGARADMRWSASRKTRLVVCFAIVYLVWGSSYLATSIGVHELPPRLFAGIRFFLAGALLIGLTLALGRRARLERGELRQVLVMAFCSILLSSGINNWALQWVDSGIAAILNASTALWIALLGTLGARAQSLTARVVGGLVLGFAGVAIIMWPGRGSIEAVPNAPQLAILVGCASWAFGTIYYRNAAVRLDVLAFTGWMMLCGGAMLILAGLGFGEAARWSWSGAGMAAMLYLTVFSSCFAYTAYAWLTHNVTPAQVGTYGYVNPAIATVLGWWLLDETLTGATLLGMVVILVGVVLVSWPSPDPQPEPTG